MAASATLLGPANLVGVPRQRYAFIVVSLAVFLISLAAVRPAVKGFVASTIIEFHPAGAKVGAAGPPYRGGSEDALVELQAAVNDGLLAKTAAAMSATGAKSEQAQALIRALREGLSIHALDKSTGAFAISLTGPDRALPVAALDELASQLLAAHGPHHDAERERELGELAAKRAEAAADVDRGRDALKAWQKRWDEHRTARQRAAAAASVFAPPTSPPAPAPMENPQWAELAKVLEQLRGRRLTLLIERLPAHPEVQDVEMRIADVEQHLAATPRFIPMPEPRISVTPQSPPRPDRIPDLAPEYAATEVALAAEGDRLRTELEVGEAQLSRAVAAYEKAMARPAPVAAAQVQLLERAKLTAIVGGAPRGLAVLGLGVAAAVVGIVAANRLFAPGAVSVFTSTDHIAQTLGIPVVAGISTSDGPTIRAAAGRSWVTAWAVRLSTGTLAGYALMLLVGIATDELAARLLVRSPLQAFALVCERFLPV